MGIFPPAIFLYENNFDILSLIQEPDWWLGGANVHAFSLWTWIIALIMSLTKSPAITFIILHLLTFCLTALALSIFVRCMDRYTVNRIFALTTGLLLISTPLVLVQTGYIYVEIPVMCFSIFAFSAWQNDREGLAVACALIALSIKLTGVAIAASICLVLLFRFFSTPKLIRVWHVLFIPTFYIVLTSIYSWLGGIEHSHGLSWGEAENLFETLWKRRLAIPEISVFLYFGLISSLIILTLPKYLIIGPATEESSNRN